jgi:hypothetical protein
LPDDTEYTLTEVVDRLPLPQFVSFVGEDFKKVLTTDLLEAVDNVQSWLFDTYKPWKIMHKLCHGSIDFAFGRWSCDDNFPFISERNNNFFI